MKIILALALIAASSAFAEDGHQHGKPLPGPNGGRIIEAAGIHAEFLVRPDRKVIVAFFTEDMKPLPPGGNMISAVAEAVSGKVILDFEKTAEGFVSTTALPEGDGYRVVLQIKSDAGARPQNIRIDYVSKLCGGCKLAEYACTCDHG